MSELRCRPNGWRPTEKVSNFLKEHSPRRFMRKHKMIRAGKRNKAGAGNGRCEPSSLFKWDCAVAFAMEHYSWNMNFRQDIGDVDLAPLVVKAGCVLGRGRNALH